MTSIDRQYWHKIKTLILSEYPNWPLLLLPMKYLVHQHVKIKFCFHGNDIYSNFNRLWDSALSWYNDPQFRIDLQSIGSSPDGLGWMGKGDHSRYLAILLLKIRVVWSTSSWTGRTNPRPWYHCPPGQFFLAGWVKGVRELRTWTRAWQWGLLWGIVH